MTGLTTMADIKYSDLNILYSDEETAHILLTEAATLGYTAVALTHCLSSDSMAQPKGKRGKKPEHLVNPIKLSPKFSEILTVDGNPLKIYRRLSVAVHDPKTFHDLGNHPLCKTFDIISVIPSNEKLLQQALDDVNVDVIELELSTTRAVSVKRKHARQAQANGKFFELSYCNAFNDDDSRTAFFSNCRKLLTDLCPGVRGKIPDVVVLSSGVADQKLLRSPVEAGYLCGLFGFPEKFSKEMNCTVAWQALNNSLARRQTAKNAVQLILNS